MTAIENEDKKLIEFFEGYTILLKAKERLENKANKIPDYSTNEEYKKSLILSGQIEIMQYCITALSRPENVKQNYEDLIRYLIELKEKLDLIPKPKIIV
ncbi:MAG: hypothetical protein QXU98_04145 [Candidatus Parvarchaeota archaeon]